MPYPYRIWVIGFSNSLIQNALEFNCFVIFLHGKRAIRARLSIYIVLWSPLGHRKTPTFQAQIANNLKCFERIHETADIF